ncbi:MAG: hypothetical protein ACR2FY_15800 [Pirellulaceae bacterium]
MEPNAKRRWPQFPLWSLLLMAMLAPPSLAGVYFLIREMDAPIWAIAVAAVQILFWLSVLILIIRRAIMPNS